MAEALAVLETLDVTDSQGHTSLPLVWGICVGLALVHAFAFGISARLVGGGRVGAHDVESAVAQLAGASVAPLLATVASLLTPVDYEAGVIQATLIALIAVIGTAVARVAGVSWARSILYGVIVALAALAVIAAKNILAGH